MGTMPAPQADINVWWSTDFVCGVMSRFVHECWDFGLCRRPAAVSASSHCLSNYLFIGSMPAVEADTQSQTVLHGDTNRVWGDVTVRV